MKGMQLAVSAIAAAAMLAGCKTAPTTDAQARPGMNLGSFASGLKDLKCLAAQGKDLAGVIKKDGEIGAAEAAGCNDVDARESRAAAPPPPPQVIVVAAPPTHSAHRCGAPHAISIENLELMPDRVPDGGKVEAFRLTYRTDRNGECRTSFSVRDSNNAIVAAAIVDRLLPGRHDITLTAAKNYKFNPRTGCFTVQANAAATHAPIDAIRKECARLVKGSRPAAYMLAL